MPLGVRDVLAEWIAQNTQNEQPLDTGKKKVEPVLKVDRPEVKNEKDSKAITGKRPSIHFSFY